MNQVDQNINKDMIDCDLIDVESLDYSDDQTWLYKIPEDSGRKLDIEEYFQSNNWPVVKDDDYIRTEKELHMLLDNIIKKVVTDEVSAPDRHKFDSRTYVKPKKRMQRPSIHSIMEVTSNTPSMSPHPSLNIFNNKYLTYNKYNNPLGPISPMLRLKTFNVDTNSENSAAAKEFSMKRRSLAPDDDPQLEDLDLALAADLDREENSSFRAINIDLSQPAHNLHNTFNKGMMNVMQESGSINMYQSGESLMRMSPPSLVSSLVMESSGNFNEESLDSRKSLSQKDSGLPTSARESLDPMMTSMTLSILDEKDMSTSFLSQTTYPDNDSLIDSLPPSLVSSVNSSYIVSNTSKPRGDNTDTNIFSSATFTHLEQSEKLLSARPRCQLYNSFKRDSIIKNSESYTKSREEACQIDTSKVLNENCDNTLSPQQSIKISPKNKPNGEMSETITLHYSNNKFKRDSDAEKENLNATFKCEDTFYNDMGMQKIEGKLSVTMDKQELNEIIQARQKLSLARKALPSEPETIKPDLSPIKTIQLPNQTIITVPRQSMENASELLSRRRTMNYDRDDNSAMRDTPKRNATFKKTSPKNIEPSVSYVKRDENIIDINSATMNLIDSAERTLQQEEWNLQERAMIGSNESTSTDTGTFSSSSPPESVPDTHTNTQKIHLNSQVASTPLTTFKKGKNELLDLHNTISPIYDTTDDKSYAATNLTSEMERTYNMNTTVINSATIKKTSAKRDILTSRHSPEKKTQRSPTNRVSPTDTVSYAAMAPPSTVPRKTNLPTSKLRQYSSHKELNRIPVNPPSAARVLAGRSMMRRGVYGSNPALSPTDNTNGAPTNYVQNNLTQALSRRESYICKPQETEKTERPVLMNPPALVRQGTETLRREKPQSQLVAPKDPPTTRPYSIAGTSQLRVSRPTSVPVQKSAPVVTSSEPRPNTGERQSGLPRPSRLPAPRRTIRPPSVYSVAPTGDEHY
ncbi:uncharacterized protein LOC116774542 isoform X3 [Danaus plexippus]|uniref:uncharacterized protein LOC116774542 isoform X3 n=1 Tax=Danaus plexippus TaxID=13037 RepID=UPI002AB26939|nr:uncharacterized protein LOC116774542 isoform X3 [Danaus plexippus]